MDANKILISFHRKKFSVKTCEYLCPKLDADEDQDLIRNLFTSKINYGVQLYGKLRVSNSDPTNVYIEAIQKVQNKMARFLNSKLIKTKSNQRSC